MVAETVGYEWYPAKGSEDEFLGQLPKLAPEDRQKVVEEIAAVRRNGGKYIGLKAYVAKDFGKDKADEAGTIATIIRIRNEANRYGLLDI